MDYTFDTRLSPKTLNSDEDSNFDRLFRKYQQSPRKIHRRQRALEFPLEEKNSRLITDLKKYATESFKVFVNAHNKHIIEFQKLIPGKG